MEPVNRKAVTRKAGEAKEPYAITAVVKAFGVLEALKEAEEMTLADIGARTGLPKSSTFRLLSTLEFVGYVERGTDDRRYRLTLKLVELSQRLLGQNPVRRLAAPHMRLLSEKYGETINLAVLSGPDVLYIEILDSRHPFRVTEMPGSRSPVYVTALGKAMAAHLPKGELERLLDQQLFRMVTPQTITTRERFVQALREVERWGYALDDGEAESGVRCIAAPILGAGGYPMGALSISAPATRLPMSDIEVVAQDIRQACRAISGRFGYHR